MVEFKGSCLCGKTSYSVKKEPLNPHLCSCTMCRKSSGALTVAWVEFPLETFQWSERNQLGLYQSSEKTQRCFCKNCGSFLGALNDGSDTIAITIGSLENSDLIIPGKQHSYKEEAPLWWSVNIQRNK